MAAAAPGALAALRAATVSFGQGAYKAASDLGPMVSGLAKFASLAQGATAAVGGTSTIMQGLAISLGEAADAAKVSAETAALIRSTGGAAQVSAGHIERLAERVSRYAAVDATAVQSAENLLMTLGGVRNAVGEGNRVFDRATMAAADMAARWGIDVRSAAMELGQALKHPIQGYQDLERRGVRFTDSQKKQIRQLSENGKTFKAQKVIMDAVGRSFAGSAKGQAQPLDRLRVTLLSVAQMLGRVLLPFVNRAATAANRFIRRLQDSGQIARWMRILRTVLDGIVKVLNVLSKTVVPFFVNTFRRRFAAISDAVRAVSAVFRGWRDLIVALVHHDFKGAWDAAKRIVEGAARFILAVFDGITAPVRTAIEMIWSGLGDSVKGVFDDIVGAIQSAIQSVASVIDKVIATANKLPGVDIGPIGDLFGGGGNGQYLERPFDSGLDKILPKPKPSRTPEEPGRGVRPARAAGAGGAQAHTSGNVPIPAAVPAVAAASSVRPSGHATAMPRVTNFNIGVLMNGREVARANRRATEAEHWHR